MKRPGLLAENAAERMTWIPPISWAICALSAVPAPTSEPRRVGDRHAPRTVDKVELTIAANDGRYTENCMNIQIARRPLIGMCGRLGRRPTDRDMPDRLDLRALN